MDEYTALMEAARELNRLRAGVENLRDEIRDICAHGAALSVDVYQIVGQLDNLLAPPAPEDNILSNTNEDGRCRTCRYLATHSAKDCPEAATEDRGHLGDCHRFPTGWLCVPECPAPAVPADLRAALDAWATEQMDALPEHRTPVAHGKAEVLAQLRAFLAPNDGEVCEKCGQPLTWKFNGGNAVWLCRPCGRTQPYAPADGARDAGRLSERIDQYEREWLWREADDEHVARWGSHMGQMLYRLPKDAQTRDMQASIESMVADLRDLAARLDAVEAERDDWERNAHAERELAKKAEAEVTSLRAELAARAGTERVQWRVRNIAKGTEAYGRTYLQISEESARSIATGKTLVAESRTVTEFASVVSPWVAVEAGDNDE